MMVRFLLIAGGIVFAANRIEFALTGTATSQSVIVGAILALIMMLVSVLRPNQQRYFDSHHNGGQIVMGLGSGLGLVAALATFAFSPLLASGIGSIALTGIVLSFRKNFVPARFPRNEASTDAPPQWDNAGTARPAPTKARLILLGILGAIVFALILAIQAGVGGDHVASAPSYGSNAGLWPLDPRPGLEDWLWSIGIHVRLY